ncbi:MAG: hypothetical protein OXF85_01400 [Candidatus Saccharibacteria bacterium]|nr:hypothetical protein [Candidatus Saccharibacteria bacterium]
MPEKTQKTIDQLLLMHKLYSSLDDMIRSITDDGKTEKYLFDCEEQKELLKKNLRSGMNNKISILSTDFKFCIVLDTLDGIVFELAKEEKHNPELIEHYKPDISAIRKACSTQDVKQVRKTIGNLQRKLDGCGRENLAKKLLALGDLSDLIP